MSLTAYERFAFAVLLTSQFLWSTTQAEPILRTKLGSIQGSVLTSDEGVEFFAFRGIPYAKPPIKELRFSPPQPYDKEYDGVLDATEDGNMCVQYQYFTKEFSGDEDCLYINVYTPKFDSQDFSELLPVMFWIHGGAFTTGSGSSDEFGPYKLIDRNVILVTINYRLGPLGFLSTLDEASPGNYGLLDQVLALKWVQDNIAFFGGDRHKVTIFGASAGSMSVGFHLISPLSKGLFHGAIAQSGSALVENIVSHDESTSLHFTQDVAKRLNCPTDCTKKMVECLKKKPVLDLIMKCAITIDNHLSTTADYFAFKPVVDTAYGQNSFLPDFPQNLIAKKQFNAVPLMAGTNKDEGILMLPAIEGIGGFLEFGKSHVPIILKQIAPALFSSEEYGLEVSKMISEKYFGNLDELDLKQKLIALTKFLSDVYFTYTIDVLNDYFVKYDVPIYAYKFTHKGERSYAELLPPSPLFSEDLQIVTHGDELQNLFRNEMFKCSVPPRDGDGKMSDIMLTLWTNFAKTKEPTMKDSAQDHQSFKWERSTLKNIQYLELNTNPRMVNGHLSYGYNVFRSAHNLAKTHKDEL